MLLSQKERKAAFAQGNGCVALLILSQKERKAVFAQGNGCVALLRIYGTMPLLRG